MNSITDALLKLIKLEEQYVGNPITCGQELIYNGCFPEICEIIIPRSGDLIQSLEIETYDTITSAYILVDINETDNQAKTYKLNVFKRTQTEITSINPIRKYDLICDYEINLLRPYQVTKLKINTKCIQPLKIYANYCFVDIDSRRKLFSQY